MTLTYNIHSRKLNIIERKLVICIHTQFEISLIQGKVVIEDSESIFDYLHDILKRTKKRKIIQSYPFDQKTASS